MPSSDTQRPVRQFDIQITKHVEYDPFEAFDEFRGSDPFWCEDHGGFWVVSRYDHVREILQDASVFSNKDALVPMIRMDSPLVPSHIDPPQLQVMRAVILPHLSPRKVQLLEPTIRRICTEFIDSIRSDGHCDIVADIAHKYPITVFAQVFGLPADRLPEFRGHAERFLHDISSRAEAWQAIRDIIRDQLQLKRRQPADDLLSAIGNARLEGSEIDLDTAINLAGTVFLGGLDTLPSSIAWTFRYLATHSEARGRIVADPRVIPAAVEEFLRLYTPTAKEYRRATRSVDFHGVNMRTGERVMALLATANRDPSEFSNPLTADFDRGINRHIAFAAGPHRCLGSHLARHELEVLLEEWHAAIPSYRIVPGANITFSGGIFSVDTLPLEWERVDPQ